MKEHWSKIVIVLLLVVIVGLPILLKPADEAGAAGEVPTNDADRLVIFTPHNEQIRYEISRAYNQYRKANGLGPVAFDWRVPGGTSDIRKSILSQYQAIADRDGDLDAGIGADLFFGGGDYDHGKVASGVEIERNGEPLAIRIIDDSQLPAELMQAVFPAERIGGERLYRKYTFTEAGQDRTYLGWTGVTLSSFGIVYNKDLLTMLGIDPPKTWTDLQNPELRGWVALADPSHSGSIAATFNTVLRREGWDEGWGLLRRVFANARYFATSSDKIPVDVSKGDAAVGMCIDFYGRFQAGAIGGNRMGYIDPVVNGQSMTATTADPVTLLRGAPHETLAQDFIAWLLSPDAQGLWQRQKVQAGIDASAASVAPDKFELRRQPIRQDQYTAENRARWTDPEIDPFPTAVPFPEGTPFYFDIIAPLTQAMAIDTHADLIEAWRAIQRATESGHPNLAKMIERFDAMPDELTLQWPSPALAEDWHAIQNNPEHPEYETVIRVLNDWNDHLGELTDSDDMPAKRVRWRAFFKDHYREIVRLGNE